jgi:hypothetical protein
VRWRGSSTPPRTGSWTAPAPVEVRDPAGAVSHSYETLPELVDVTATVVPAAEQSRDAEVVAVGDRYDKVRVAATLGRRETVLVAQRGAL